MRILGPGNAGTQPHRPPSSKRSSQRASGAGRHRDAHACTVTHGASQKHYREPGEINMRFSIDVGSELELKLYQAVLLYRNDHGNRFMATVHAVVQKETDGTPLLGSGQLLSTAALRELAKQLGTSCPAEFLPENVVARTAELIAWWTPAVVRTMFFRDGSELAGISGKLFPHPALLFVVRNQALFVRAFPKNRRPDPDTKLAAAPYWNIDSNGAVCAGTMRAPKSLTVASIPAWQQAFFQSEFTHPGGAGRLTKRKGGTAALWKSLTGKKVFPISALIEMEPLNEYLRKLEVAQR